MKFRAQDVEIEVQGLGCRISNLGFPSQTPIFLERRLNSPAKN